MPELPEVETFKRYLDSTSLHQRITGLEVRDAYILKRVSAHELTHRLKGRRFENSHRHGKHLFVRAGDELWLRLHFGMTGSLEYFNYADEILFHARMHPATEAARLSDKHLRRLFRATRYVLDKAIALKTDFNRLPKSWLLTHRGKRGRCPRCGRALKSAIIGGRTAWFCTHCQKRI